ATRICFVGDERDRGRFPLITKSGDRGPWADLVAAGSRARPLLIDDLCAVVGDLVGTGHWDRPPEQALLVPLHGQDQLAGFVIAGLNPYRRHDAGYEGFLGLLAGQIEASLGNARAYEEERRRAETLAELDRAKTAFFSNVSHEFRTPLTLMLGPLEDALARSETAESEPLRRELDLAHRNGLRLLRMVNTLLDFA